MSRIKIFKYINGVMQNEEELEKEINDFIKNLYKRGIIFVDINVTTTGNGLFYTLIWNE